MAHLHHVVFLMAGAIGVIVVGGPHFLFSGIALVVFVGLG